MRIWNIPPSLLCRKHLLGEHVESHMFVGAIKSKHDLKGYINNGLVEIHNLRKRHDELAIEIQKRGYKHSSSLPEFKAIKAGEVDPVKNTVDLFQRCSWCKNNIQK